MRAEISRRGFQISQISLLNPAAANHLQLVLCICLVLHALLPMFGKPFLARSFNPSASDFGSGHLTKATAERQSPHHIVVDTCQTDFAKETEGEECGLNPFLTEEFSL